MPEEATEGMAAAGFADQRVHKPMARWRLGRAALETGERDWAAAGQAIAWALGEGGRAAAQEWAGQR
eukprot:8969790-Alexandrium_andersonii.AAC.1